MASSAIISAKAWGHSCLHNLKASDKLKASAFDKKASLLPPPLRGKEKESCQNHQKFTRHGSQTEEPTESRIRQWHRAQDHQRCAIHRGLAGLLLKKGCLVLMIKTINEADTTDSMNQPVRKWSTLACKQEQIIQWTSTAPTAKSCSVSSRRSKGLPSGKNQRGPRNRG